MERDRGAVSILCTEVISLLVAGNFRQLIFTGQVDFFSATFSGRPNDMYVVTDFSTVFNRGFPP